MKNIFVLVLILITQYSYGGGITGAGPGDKMSNFSTRMRIKMPVESLNGFESKTASQVYYMRQKQAEIQFATNTPGDNKVDIQSLRVEEISNPALLEGLKRSQQTKQWENIKLPNKGKFDDLIKNLTESESGLEQ